MTAADRLSGGRLRARLDPGRLADPRGLTREVSTYHGVDSAIATDTALVTTRYYLRTPCAPSSLNRLMISGGRGTVAAPWGGNHEPAAAVGTAGTGQPRPVPAAVRPAAYPGQPGWGPQPQPPRKNWFLRHKILTGVLTVIVPFVIIVIAAGVSGGTHLTPTAAGPSAPQDTTQNAGNRHRPRRRPCLPRRRGASAPRSP